MGIVRAVLYGCGFGYEVWSPSFSICSVSLSCGTFLCNFHLLDLLVLLALYFPFHPRVQAFCACGHCILWFPTQCNVLPTIIKIFITLVGIWSLQFINLGGMLTDSLREMRRYQSEVDSMGTTTPEVNRISTHMKLFRAQRNFYMSFFVCLCWMWVLVVAKLLMSSSVVSVNHLYE